jgi:diacylglycerol kinase family enzyme
MLLLVNEAAGSADQATLAKVRSALSAAGRVEVAVCGQPEDLEAALDRRPAGPVVVAGGDGSVHTVVNALARRRELGDTVLGLVPMGTGNDLARGVGIPLDPVAAARRVVEGQPEQLDLIRDDTGDLAVNAVHIGVGGEAAVAARRWKPAFGRASFRLGSLTAGIRATGWRLRIILDGRPLAGRDGRVLMVGLSNAPVIGGGTPLAPGARSDDGLMDVVVSFATGPIERLSYAVRLRKGTHLERPDVLHARAREATVEGDPFPINADGEVGGPVRTRTWSVAPKSWRLILPAADATADGPSGDNR